MDAVSFERVYDGNSRPSLRPPSAASSGGSTAGITFRRCWCRTRSGATPRISRNRFSPMQRFLTGPGPVIGRLQILGPEAGTPGRGVGVRWQRLPQAGQEIGGSYCGRLGKVANCQGWDVPGLQPARALVDKRLYLPKSWTSDQDRCAAAGVPEDRRNYRSKTELALELLERVLELGYLRAEWVAGDDAFGMSPTFREGLAALGMRYVLDVPGGTTVWPLDPAWTSTEYPGFGRPRKPRLRDGQRRTMEQRGDELPDEAWREITVAQGSQGPRTYRFSAQRVRATRRRKPGEELWAVWRRNLDGSEPRYYLSNAPEDTTLESRGWV